MVELGLIFRGVRVIGCDIHVFIQTRKNEHSPWELGEQVEMDRNYELFDLISNVRGDQYKRLSTPVSERYVSVMPSEKYLKEWSDSNLRFIVPAEFGESVVSRVGRHWDEEGHIYIGDHSFSILTPKDIMNYKQYYKIDKGYDDYILKTIGKLLMKMLATTKSSKNVRCIIGYDS